MRQDPEEIMLISAVNELATGNVSDATKAFLSSLSRELVFKPFEVTHLCALNDQVQIYNKSLLKDVKSKEMKYMAVDSGNTKVLGKLAVEKVQQLFKML
jgi:hypothetical protein